MKQAALKQAALKHAAPFAAAALTLLVAASPHAEPLYPEVINTSHATPQVAAFFKSYFTAKSEHKPVPTTEHFSEAHLTYIDAALGWPFYSKKSMTDLFEAYMPKWPPAGLSYPTRISGDTHSAVVAFTDTPELFGGEIRILAAIDFKDGKIVRWIDYWDGRSFGTALAAKMRTPPDKFPTNFDYDVASEGASAKIRTYRKSSRPRLPQATPQQPMRCSAMMRSISTVHCAYASSVGRRSAHISAAFWRPYLTAKAQS
jgi:hypothetical protein